VTDEKPIFKIMNPSSINRSATPDINNRQEQPKTLQKQVFDVMNNPGS